jgi:hypothetical protein
MTFFLRKTIIFLWVLVPNTKHGRYIFHVYLISFKELDFFFPCKEVRIFVYFCADYLFPNAMLSYKIIKIRQIIDRKYVSDRVLVEIICIIRFSNGLLFFCLISYRYPLQ